MNAPPGEEQVVPVRLNASELRPGVEYFLTVRFRLRTDTLWAKAGHVVAWDQIPVPVPAATVAVKTPLPVVKVWKEGGDWRAAVGGVAVRVEGQHGTLVSFAEAGREALAGALQPNFWRVPTDNDLGWKVSEKMGAWKDVMDRADLQTLDGKQTEEGALITATWNLPIEATTVALTYLLRGDGSLQVGLSADLGAGAPELPRIGMQFAVPGEWDDVRWFGRGPQENYCDRKTGAAVGIYENRVGGWISHYVRPQENANRTDTRWIRFSGADGTGLMARSSGRPFGMSAWPYSAHDLESAKHDYEVPHRQVSTVNLDGWQMGVGGDTSWGLPVHNEYRILDKGPHRFAFDLLVVTGKEASAR